MSIEIRLSEFCQIIGEPRETVRSILNRDDAPFSREGRGGGAQRTYNGDDLIKWFGFQALRDAGLAVHTAAHLMRYSGAVPEFFEQMEAGRDISDFCLIYGQGHADESGWWRRHYTFGRGADVAALLAQTDERGQRTKHVVAVPFLPVYLACVERAGKHDLRFKGRDLIEAEE